MTDAPRKPELPELLRPGREGRPVVVRMLLLLAGIVFMILGVIGWLLPVVTGIPFYVVGVVLLATASVTVRRWINGWERKLSHRKRLGLRKLLRKIPNERLRSSFDLGDDEPPRIA
jgi:hypothetical protein